MRRNLSVGVLAPVVALLWVGCSASPPQALALHNRSITNGIPDDGDPGVVALGGCTGTLITPRVVVTAAHCLVDHPKSVSGGADPAQPDWTLAIVNAWPHPDFDPSTHDNDIGLALVDPPPPSTVDTWPVWSSPLEPAFIGERLRLVGFGRDPSEASSTARKREGFTVVSAMTDSTFSFGPTPSQTCGGDSGGPAFMTRDGVEYLVGVTSHGDALCVDHATDIRTDRYWRDFVAPYLARVAPASSPVGDRCFYDGQCAAGECFAAPDDPRLRYCTTRCSDDTPCPRSMTCTSSGDVPSCRHSTPTPGTQGGRCDTDFDCVEGICGQSFAGAARTCGTRCVPNESTCPSGSECSPGLDDSRTYACWRTAFSDGGCSLAPLGTSGTNGWPALMLLAIAAIAGAARCRRARGITASSS